MARFNPATYDPKADSSKGHKDYDYEGVVLVVPEGTCPDGCGKKPNGAKRVFRQGHDARLKGICIRAGATDNTITTVTGDKAATEAPMEVARRYGFADQVKQGIEIHQKRAKAQVEKAAQRAAKADAKAKAPKAEAPKSLKGQVFGVKVGRWPVEATVTKVAKGVATLTYETKAGEEKTIERKVEDLQA